MGSLSLSSALSLSLAPRGGGGGTPPIELPAGRILALSSADITPQADNTNLSAWPDSIGTADASASVGNIKYRTNRENGRPSVQFSGAANMSFGRPAALTGALDSTECTMMLVCKALGYESDFASILSNGGFNGVSRVVSSNGAGTGGTRSRPISSGFHVIAWTQIGDNRAKTYVDGTGVGTGPVGGSGSDAILLGSLFADGSHAFIGEAFEFHVWDRALGQTEIMQSVMYFCDLFAKPYPWAGQTHFPAFQGDSITAGGFQQSYPEICSIDLLGLSYGKYTNIGVHGSVPSQEDDWAEVDFDGIYALTGLIPIIIWGEWANQRGGPGASSQIAAAQSYLANRKAAQPNCITVFWNSTALGGGSAGGVGDTGADNVTLTTQGQGRVAYNTHDWASEPDVDYFVNMAANTNIGVPGTCPYNNALFPTTYFADATHPSVAAAPSGSAQMAGEIAPTLETIMGL